MLARGQLEFYKFAGAGALNGNIDNAAAVDQSSNYEPMTYGRTLGVVRIPIATHGLILGASDKFPTHIAILGSTNYDGLRRIVAVPNAGAIDIAAKYVAETFSGGGAEIFRPAVTFDEPWEFVGWEIHVDAAPATSANLIVKKDSAAGTYWDSVYFTDDMNTVTDWVQVWDTPIPMAPNDAIFATWANANGDDWGFEFKVRRLN